MEKEKKRSIAPDVCRGIAIFLVVWGHVLQQGLFGIADILENCIVKIIYSFHMPLFIIISGYYFYVSSVKKKSKELIFDRGISLLKVIFLWNTIHYLVSVLLGYCLENKIAFSMRAWWKNIMEGYWFLWAILFCILAVGITVKFFPKRLWWLGFFVFIPIALLSPCRWVILSIYPFFIGGFLYNRFSKEGKGEHPWMKYMVPVVFVAVLALYFFRPAVGNSEWREMINVSLEMLRGTVGVQEVVRQAGNVLLYYVLGVTGSVSVIVLVNLVLHRMQRNKMVSFLASLGQYSLQIYILQRILVELLLGKCYQKIADMAGYNPIEANMHFFTWIFSPIISAVCTITIYYLVRRVFCGKVGAALFGR